MRTASDLMNAFPAREVPDWKPNGHGGNPLHMLCIGQREHRFQMNRKYRGMWRTLGALAVFLAVATSLEAQAGPTHSKEDFTHERFAELQAQGALILVDIFADWCPTCAIQQTVLAEYREQHPSSWHRRPRADSRARYSSQEVWPSLLQSPARSSPSSS